MNRGAMPARKAPARPFADEGDGLVFYLYMSSYSNLGVSPALRYTDGPARCDNQILAFFARQGKLRPLLFREVHPPSGSRKSEICSSRSDRLGLDRMARRQVVRMGVLSASPGARYAGGCTWPVSFPPVE